MKTIGSALMIAGICVITLLYLSIFGLLPKAVDDRLPGDYFRLFGLFGLGIGSIISGYVIREFKGILQAVLDGVKESQKDDESDIHH